MIVKLLKPTPLVDHVAHAGEFIDGDALLKRMVASGHAVLVDDGNKNADTLNGADGNNGSDGNTATPLNAPATPDKPVKIPAKKKPADDGE